MSPHSLKVHANWICNIGSAENSIFATCRQQLVQASATTTVLEGGSK